VTTGCWSFKFAAQEERYISIVNQGLTWAMVRPPTLALQIEKLLSGKDETGSEFMNQNLTWAMVRPPTVSL